MDNNSVNNCATVAHMRQKPSNPAFRGGSQLAYQASRWTRYASRERTNWLSNHNRDWKGIKKRIIIKVSFVFEVRW